MTLIAERLRTAIERQELRLVYQPIVRMEDGEVNALEALLRWSPDGVEVPPSDFIPVAEGTGLIHRVGAWVLETACRQVRALTAADPARTPLVVHVNISPFQLDDECWPDQ